MSQPIFTAGRLRSTVRLAEAQREIAVAQYQKAIQTAFTEVSNALIAHQRVQEASVKQEGLVAVLEERKRLAYMRYQGGVDTQLNALDSDRDLLQAKLDLRQIKLNELLSVVQLYKALGGAKLTVFRNRRRGHPSRREGSVRRVLVNNTSDYRSETFRLQFELSAVKYGVRWRPKTKPSM